ncbi:ion transporter [Peptococcaceae bacterium]|nr:ion transporter [Peptococcaceae bacterium]
MNLTKLKFLYELTMVFLALLVAVTVFREIFTPISSYELKIHAYINKAVLIIFAVDYFVRLAVAKDKKHFIKTHIPELIAIIPFESIFQLARLVRLVYLIRLIRLFRAIIIFKKYYKTVVSLFQTNNLHYVTIATIAIALLGAVGIQHFERDTGNIKNFGDALWWSVVTITTVGYGDISPVTTYGRILAAFLMITGIGFLGMLTGTIATYFVDRILKKKKPQTLDAKLKQVIISKIEKVESLDKQEFDELLELIKFCYTKNKKTNFLANKITA